MSDQVIYNPQDPARTGSASMRLKRISWPAVFAGVLVALGAEVLFLSFGSFIGFILGPGGGAVPWSYGWFWVSSFFCIGAGGWVAARLSGNPLHGRLHGIVTWGLAVFTTFVFVTIVSWGMVTNTVRLATGAAMVTAQTMPPTTPNEANRLANQTSNQAPYVLSTIRHDVQDVSLAAWIGVLLAAFASIIGGGLGAPKNVPVPPGA